MKEKLSNVFGTVGVILYYILGFIIAFLPLIILKPTFIVSIVAFFVMYSFPGAGFIMWIRGLIVVIQEPQTALSIIYYIAFALMYVPTFIIALLDLIALITTKIQYTLSDTLVKHIRTIFNFNMLLTLLCAFGIFNLIDTYTVLSESSASFAFLITVVIGYLITRLECNKYEKHFVKKQEKLFSDTHVVSEKTNSFTDTTPQIKSNVVISEIYLSAEGEQPAKNGRFYGKDMLLEKDESTNHNEPLHSMLYKPIGNTTTTKDISENKQNNTIPRKGHISTTEQNHKPKIKVRVVKNSRDSSDY